VLQPLVLLLPHKFALCHLPEVLVGGIDSELLVLQDSSESLVLDVTLKVGCALDAIVLLANKQSQLCRLLGLFLRVSEAQVFLGLLEFLGLKLLLLALFLPLALV